MALRLRAELLAGPGAEGTSELTVVLKLNELSRTSNEGKPLRGNTDRSLILSVHNRTTWKVWKRGKTIKQSHEAIALLFSDFLLHG